MRFIAKIKDDRLRFYGPGKPRFRQPGEISIDVQDEVIQGMISQALTQSAYLPLSGGVLTGLLTIQSGGLTINGGALTLGDINLVLSAATGTKIGTATTQKLSFYNSTPIVQPSSTGQTAGFTAGSGSAANDDSTFTGGTGTKAYTIGDIVKHLKTLGLLASS